MPDNSSFKLLLICCLSLWVPPTQDVFNKSSADPGWIYYFYTKHLSADDMERQLCMENIYLYAELSYLALTYNSNIYAEFAHLRGLLSNFDTECLRNLNARVFTNQMWRNGQTDGRRTKTNPKTSPGQSGELKSEFFSPILAIFQFIRDINKTNVLTKKTPPPTWRPYIIKTNLFTKFHDDWTKNVTSRVKMRPPPGSHEANVLTKFHYNWAKNVTSRVFTCFYYIHIETQPTGGHFHDDWAKNVTSLLHVFQRTRTIFELNSHWIKNVTSRVLTCFHYIHIAKTAPPLGGHVFSPIWTIFKLVRDINKTNVLTKFHDDWAKIVNWARNVTFTVFTSFELDRDTIGTNLLTKFHEDRTRNVDCRVFTTKCGRTDGRRTDGRTTDKDRPQKLT
ncbi:hypothetical protein DPMN_058708 [Dreissena polymorpha]|uniref:Uncharacterized protein n=1 Tax=Dreissena polymorpha TaxID=45954 RepID=A0A9D4C287_DREPO|nr:hypothetical protein DPMN_058708 [Dreissena polymorpha]